MLYTKHNSTTFSNLMKVNGAVAHFTNDGLTALFTLIDNESRDLNQDIQVNPVDILDVFEELTFQEFITKHGLLVHSRYKSGYYVQLNNEHFFIGKDPLRGVPVVEPSYYVNSALRDNPVYEHHHQSYLDGDSDCLTVLANNRVIHGNYTVSSGSIAAMRDTCTSFLKRNHAAFELTPNSIVLRKEL